MYSFPPLDDVIQSPVANVLINVLSYLFILPFRVVSYLFILPFDVVSYLFIFPFDSLFVYSSF